MNKVKDYFELAKNFKDVLKLEMNRIPKVIADIFKPLRQRQIMSPDTDELIPGCFYFQTGSSRWDTDEKDSDIDIVVLPYWAYDINAWKLPNGNIGPNTITYNFFRDHPDRCYDEDHFSSKFSIKIKLSNGKKVDAIVVNSIDKFLEWYYATRNLDFKIEKDGYEFDGLDLDYKTDRVSYFEVFRNEYSFKRLERFLKFDPSNLTIPDFQDDLVPFYDKISEEYLEEDCRIDNTGNLKGAENNMNDDLITKLDINVIMSDLHMYIRKEIELLNKIKQKETEMSEIEVEVIQKLDCAKLIAAVPGVSDDSIEVTVDNEDNIIFISVNASEVIDEDVKKLFELSREASVNLNKKYDVNTAKIELSNGILTITVPTNKGRIKKIKVGK